ncbi:MAG TPA: sugar phosphate nucleotidyltransferase [Bryobacteraceae bacterium]|nr:sugar phosphate nucleotidyltransferase [Bryobacteraceae bacterium]
MRIRKAVITAAGKAQRALPLQTLIDSDGEEKSVLQILVEQALDAGVEEVGIVVWPGDESRYSESVAASVRGRLHFVPQPQPLGYAHALYCAQDFVAAEPFLHLVGDHLCVPSGPEPCALRIMQIAAEERCAVSAVQATRESLLPHYGTAGGRRVAGRQDLYRVETVIEKPTPTEAEQRLHSPGMRAGHYLCFFGMHVLTPAVMDLVGQMLASEPAVTLSAALADFARREQYLALVSGDRRYDLGARYGLLTAQLALSLNGRDRQEVLADLVDLLATRELAAAR